MNFVKEAFDGFRLGRRERKLYTELRRENIDLWETENPSSPYYAKTEESRQQSEQTFSLAKYVGLCFGQLMHPREWYKNCKYIGFDDPPDNAPIMPVYASGQGITFTKYKTD